MSIRCRTLVAACLATSTGAALAAAPAAAAAASAAIAGTQGQSRLTFQVPGDYAQRGSVTEGGRLDGRYVSQHELPTGVVCATAMTVRGLLRGAAQRPVREGSVVRWPVGRRVESLRRVDAAGRLADGGRWWTSASSTIETRDEFPTSEPTQYLRFGAADVRAPTELPAGRSVLAKVLATSYLTLAPGPAPAPGTTRPVPSATDRQQCLSHARRRLPADVRRVLRHLDVGAGVEADPSAG